jgi:competence protein ComEC
MKPPIAVLFTLSYAAGLVTGLLHFWALAGVAVMALGALWLWRRPIPGLLLAAAASGGVSGMIAWAHEAGSCPARLPTGSVHLRVRVLEPTDSLGGRIAVVPVKSSCHGLVTARWPRGRVADAGLTFRVDGNWIPRTAAGGRPSGMLVVTGVGPGSGTPSSAARLRTALARASGTLYGSRAPMVEALILGRRDGIDRELQDRFAQAGLVHLLSISGFHVGVITTWIFLLSRLLRLSRPRALAVAAAVSVVYVAFLGWPAPAARAAALAVLLALSRIRQRRVEANALLATTALCVLLIDPWSVLDLGGWLSVAALWGATMFTRWSDRALRPTVGWRTLASSIGATLATAPLTAAVLGTVAIVGILLNFVAIPLAAVAIPGVFASLILYPIWPWLAGALAGGGGLGLHLLELLATAGAAVPFGHFLTLPGLNAAVPWLTLLLITVWAVGRRNTIQEAGRRVSWGCAFLLSAGLFDGWPLASADHAAGFSLHFLNVGQGDGAVLHTPAGRWILIDAGPVADGDDAGRRVVIPFLLRHGARELALAFVSHAHADHLGGVPSVLQRFHAGLVIEPGEQVADPLYYGFLQELLTDSIPWHIGRRGEHFRLDSLDFTILHPDRAWQGWGEDLNEDSLVLLIEYHDFQVLFAGDAGFPAEQEMRPWIRRVDLLKIGHHGSRGSTSDAWLDSLQPEAAIISVGHNTYGHPAPETLGRLRRHGVATWRTDQDGTVSVTTDGHQMTVESRRGRVTYRLGDESTVQEQ